MARTRQAPRAVADETAGLISSLRKEILAAYEDRVRLTGAQTANNPDAMDRALADAHGILTELTRALGAGPAETGRTDGAGGGEHTRIAAARADPYEITESMSLLFDAVLSVVTPYIPAEPMAPHTWQALVTTLQRILAVRMRASFAEHTGVAPSGVPRALAEERRRIARELHDRMGYCLSMTQRQLELYDIRRASDPPVAEGHWEEAWEALQESMRHLRVVTSTLHDQQPPRSLDAALRAYLGAADTGDSLVGIQVSGDETWAPPRVLDECFLVLREAARNALAHARPRSLRITVAITPHELRGTVLDNGRGFDTTGTAREGFGLISMAERTELLGGQLALASVIDVGTVVRFAVPLRGRSVENIT